MSTPASADAALQRARGPRVALAWLALLMALLPTELLGGIEARSVVIGTLLEKGRPVAGAEIQLGYVSSFTSESGEFFLEVPPGRHELTVVPPGSDALRYQIRIEFKAGKQEVPIELTDWSPKVVAAAGSGGGWLATAGLFERLQAAVDAVARLATRRGIPAAQVRLAGDGLYAVTVGEAAPRAEAEAMVARLAPAFDQAFLAPADVWTAPFAQDGVPTAEEVARALIELLPLDDRRTRVSARQALSNLGQPAVEPLLAALDRKDYRIDLGALEALGGMTAWEAAPGSLDLLRGAAARYPNEPTVLDSHRRALAHYDWSGVLRRIGFEGPNAVRDFQAKAGLAPDGIVGPQTRAVIESWLSAKRTSADVPRAPARVFIHVAGEAQMALAEKVADRLRSVTLDGQPLTVPREIVQVQRAPAASEFRFLKNGDAEEAGVIYRHLKTMLGDLALRDLSAVYDKVPNVRSRTYELWLVDG